MFLGVPTQKKCGWAFRYIFFEKKQKRMPLQSLMHKTQPQKVAFFCLYKNKPFTKSIQGNNL